MLRRITMGALAGLSAFGLEELTNLLASEGPHAMADFQGLTLVSVVVGGLLGTLGYWGWVGGVGLVLVAVARLQLMHAAVPQGWVVLVAPLWLGLAVALPKTMRWRLGKAITLVVVMALALNLNVFASPFSHNALMADLAVLQLGVVGGLVNLSARVILPAGVAIWFGVALVTATNPPATPTPGTPGPDVVLVSVDTLRRDRLALMTQTRALAETGVLFTNTSSPSSWTLPSMASILTGNRPAEHGAGQHSDSFSGTSIAQVLQQKGVATGGFTTNPWLDETFGFHRGFDIYDDALGVRRTAIAHQVADGLGLGVWQDRYTRPAAEMVAAAQQWWNATQQGSQFLWLHLMDPHGPCLLPIHSPKACYDAEIMALDGVLAPFLKRLVADGAWVVFVSDHGEAFGEHATAFTDVSLPKNTRHGHSLFQEVVAIPMFMVGPGLGPGIDDSPRSASQIPEMIQAIFEGAPVVPPAPACVIAEGVRWGPGRTSARMGPLKLVRSHQGDVVYNLDVDAGEMHPINYDSHLHQPLLDCLEGMGTTPASPAPAPELEDALKALGYLE